MKLIVGNDTDVGDVNCTGNCQADFGDIRFTDSDNNTIAYWMQNYTSGVQATFWINNSANSSSINMYYGTSGTNTTTSNGTNTFIDFDDCDTLTGWDTDTGAPAVSGSTIVLNKDVDTRDEISKSISGLGSTFAYHVRMKDDTTDTAGRWGIGTSSLKPSGSGWGGAYFGFASGTLNAYYDSGWNAVGSYSDNVYFILEVLVNDATNTFDVVIDDGTPSTGHKFRYDITITDKGGYQSSATYNLVLDWMFCRDYTTGTEPSFSSFGDEQEQPTGATVPTVATNDATGVEETNTTIVGRLTNNGSADTTCYFLLNTTDDFGSPIFNVSKGVVANDALFSNDTTPMTTLTPGTLYYFDTQANNSAGWDVTGTSKSFLTKPNEPTGASCNAGEDYINVSWTGATGADRYSVRYDTDGPPATSTSGTNFTNTTLLYYNTSLGGNSYNFSVWSFASEGGWSQYSDSNSTTSGTEITGPTWYSESFGGNVPIGWFNTAPTVECNSTGSFPANQSSDISPQPTVAANVNDTDGNESTVWFYNSTDGSTWTLQQTNTTILNETVTYVYTEASSYNTKYYWKVSANDTNDNTSVSFEFTTEDLTPDAPASLSAVTISATQIDVSWTDQTGADTTRIEQHTSADETWEPGDHDFVYNDTAEATSNSSLSSDTSYWYKAWSYNTTQDVWGVPAWDNDTTTDSCLWYGSSFGGSAAVLGIAATYVDDDRDGGWYDETHVKTIQEGIDNVSVDGTVYVWEGTYNENVIVNKTVSVIGNGSSVVTVDAGDTLSAMNITSDWVNLSGVKTIDSGTTFSSNAGIKITSNYTNVSSCNSSSNGADGIQISNDSGYIHHVDIYDCTVYSNADDGIMIISANNCDIINNVIRLNVDDGIYLVWDTHNNTIHTNNFTDNNFSVYITYGKDNTIYNNYFGNTSFTENELGENDWNVTKVVGTNIIGGANIGGNYWSDYTGYDSGDDGLGDTDLPHNCSELIQIGGDYHPLTTFTSYIDVSIENNSWDGGNPSAGSSFRTNCTFWQNGSLNLDVVVVINSTNGNFTLVNYTDYGSQDEYCGNFTTDAWSSETSINISTWPPNTYILQEFATGSHLLGFRIWVPTSFSTDKREDFEVILVATEHT